MRVKKENTIYDIYLMNLSGISIFSGCTGTDYCRAHVGQHELHTGFFSAMHSFSKEAFQGSNIRSIDMANVQLNFLIDYPRELMLVLVSPITAKKRVVKRQLKKIMDVYLANYADKVQANVMSEDLFQQMMSELRRYGIIHTEHLQPVDKLQLSFDKIAVKVKEMLTGKG